MFIDDFQPNVVPLFARHVVLWTAIHIVYRAMVEEKSVAVSFRVTPRFKRLLEAAASRGNRSQTNMLETVLFEYCRANGIEDTVTVLAAADEKGVTKK